MLFYYNKKQIPYCCYNTFQTISSKQFDQDTYDKVLRTDVISILRYNRKQACVPAEAQRGPLVNQHRVAIKVVRGTEKRERERTALFESLDNFTLLMHVTLLRSTIGTAHATLKRRVRNASAFNSRQREREKGKPPCPVLLIISLVMARTDNFSLTCLDHHHDPPLGSIIFFFIF